MKQGGTAGIPSLTKVYFVKDFFIAMNKLLEPCHEERSLEMIRPTLEEAMQYLQHLHRCADIGIDFL